MDAKELSEQESSVVFDKEWSWILSAFSPRSLKDLAEFIYAENDKERAYPRAALSLAGTDPKQLDQLLALVHARPDRARRIPMLLERYWQERGI
jgi:hypothetical protein